ncbi:hypothetical protein L1887_09519 [Cichorium endivia]|nr:hypothetical protein L1887_09519 [Cichorium endivia]
MQLYAVLPHLLHNVPNSDIFCKQATAKFTHKIACTLLHGCRFGRTKQLPVGTGKLPGKTRRFSGERKTLVFYNGELQKNELVLSRVFHKSSGGNKVHVSGLMKMDYGGNELLPSTLPPLMDSSVAARRVVTRYLNRSTFNRRRCSIVFEQH